jgi:magnesium transporter
MSDAVSVVVDGPVPNGGLHAAAATLGRRYLLDFPREAAQQIERMPIAAAARLLAQQPDAVRVRVWEAIASDVAAGLLEALPADAAALVLAEAEPAASAAALSQLDEAPREALLARLQGEVARELRELMAYPRDVAGHLMDPRSAPLRTGMTAGDALARLKALPSRGLRELFVIEDQARLIGRVEIQDLAVSDDATPLAALMKPLLAVANDLEPREDFVDRLQQQPITELPVVDIEGRFVGVIRQAAIVAAVEQETSLDVQAMVGASRDERALSTPAFAVSRRLPWLQINLLTAFLAAAVVGLFEGTIAKFTALAVLLPVVAGQSGNAGAQALAVTMRALALREITLRHWYRVLGKEAVVGLVNGLAVALTAGLGVYFWSGSLGLVLVCMLSMVISMLVAGLAGALVPVLLKRFGQDPALASSIILTTVTDVVGFFSFLGIATLLSFLLVPG